MGIYKLDSFNILSFTLDLEIFNDSEFHFPDVSAGSVGHVQM